MATPKKRGRPPLAGERTTRRLDLRLTDSEFAAIKAISDENQRHVADTARRLLVALAAVYDGFEDDDPLVACLAPNVGRRTDLSPPRKRRRGVASR
jgi:hypothetical protein